MRKLVLALNLILIVVISGCSRNGPMMIAPISPSPSPAVTTTAPDFPGLYNITELTQSQPYRVTGEANLVNDNLSHSAGLWYIIAPEADSSLEYAQTAIRAVLDLYNFYRRDHTGVLLIAGPGINIPYASASYSADGLGALGMTGSNPAKPMYWRVRILDDQPFTETELAVAQLWQLKIADFTVKHDGILSLSSLSYDEKAVRQYISDRLKIPYTETRVRLLKMIDYRLAETQPNHPALERFHDPPVSEALVQNLFESAAEFDRTTQAKIGKLISTSPPALISQFDKFYQSAEAVSRESRWMAFSSWRPYVQSDEYRQLLRFCQTEGPALWPLLVQKLAGESRYFAGGLIIDSTLPEYLYYHGNSGTTGVNDFIQALVDLL